MMGPREMLLPCGKRLLLMPGREDALRGPVIFWPMSEEHGRPMAEAAAYICGRVREMTRESDAFVLAALSVEDWNGELSPWKAEIPEMGQQFSGGGPETLRKIRAEAMPAILQMLDAQDPAGKAAPLWMIAGYSLAGLFALWAAYRTSRFAGAAAASPSVWFPGFTDFMQANRIQSKAVYLSLGDREDKAKNPVMATVGSRIREAEGILKAQGIPCALEWNPGNHFRDADIRTAKAFAWVLTRTGEDRT